MDSEPTISMPLQARPRFLVGGVASHGAYPREFYRLPKAWCLHAYRYEAKLWVDHMPLTIAPGHVGVIPANVDIAFQFTTAPCIHVYAHYQLTRRGPEVAVPAMQPLGLRFESFFAEMEKIIATASANRTRAEVKLWDLLWELAERRPADAPDQHPAVTQTLNHIELRLSQRLRVQQLAADVGLSHNHLTRLFHRQTSMTIVQYIRRRRIERARQLLSGSNRSIKSIAAEVGIPDLQHFNKLIRRETGTSPRALR